jgi:hypothetical protein
VLHQGLVSAKERWLYAAAWLPGDAATWKIERQRCECERKGRQSASTSYGFVPTILVVAVALLVDNGSSMPSSASSTTTALYQDSSGTTHGQTGHMAGGADGGNLGGSSGYTTWVRTWWVRKTIYFGRNALQIAIFRYFVVLHPIHFQKHMTSGSGVRGKAGQIWVGKVFNCFLSL